MQLDLLTRVQVDQSVIEKNEVVDTCSSTSLTPPEMRTHLCQGRDDSIGELKSILRVMHIVSWGVQCADFVGAGAIRS